MPTESFLSRLIAACYRFFIPYEFEPQECSHRVLLDNPPKKTKLIRCGMCGGMQLMAGTDLREYLVAHGILNTPILEEDD